jgi:hypothetical protein
VVPKFNTLRTKLILRITRGFGSVPLNRVHSSFVSSNKLTK